MLPGSTTTHENCVYRATGAGACLLYGACPQLLAGEARALSEGAKFRPGNRGQHGGRVSKSRKAAVNACDDILAPYDVRIARDALGDELGCSMKLVVESIMPGAIHFPSGSCTSSKTAHSCS